MNQKSRETLSFIMAGYNEENYVIPAVKAVEEALEASFEQYEIILVDDGSRDRTLPLMKTCAEENPHIRVLENRVNLNYGASVLRGMKAAENDWLVYDAFDLEMAPAEFVRLFQEMDRSLDVLVFERASYEATAWRKFASLLNRGLLHLLFPMLMRGTPTLNHTQLFRRECLDEIIPLSRSPIFFSPEMVFRAKLKGLKVGNQVIPFHSIDGIRKGAFGHVYDILWAVTDMFRFRLRLWGGRI
ncbi:MAG: glycosyltransferase family 2 protein [Oscillospiraceae bacterium]|nr:glycosyltransferase family 2 protein [Oscillospiraceae bacterium]